MGLDINKIIEESVQEFEDTTGVAKKAIAEKAKKDEEELTDEEKKELEELVDDEEEKDSEEEEEDEDSEEDEELEESCLQFFESAIIPSIAAGMGAVSLRKRIKHLQESGGQLMEVDDDTISDAATKAIDKVKDVGEDGAEKVKAGAKAIKNAIVGADDKVKIPVAAAVGGTTGAAVGYKLGKKKKLQEDQDLMEISDKWKKRLKTGAKVGAGAAALGGAAMAAHAAMKGDDAEDAGKGVSNTIKAHSDEAAWGNKASKVTKMGGRDADGADNVGSSTMTSGEKQSRAGGKALLNKAKADAALEKDANSLKNAARGTTQAPGKVAAKVSSGEAARTGNYKSGGSQSNAMNHAKKIAGKMHYSGR